jgi:hypothetical protein
MEKSKDMLTIEINVVAKTVNITGQNRYTMPLHWRLESEEYNGIPPQNQDNDRECDDEATEYIKRPMKKTSPVNLHKGQLLMLKLGKLIACKRTKYDIPYWLFEATTLENDNIVVAIPISWTYTFEDFIALCDSDFMIMERDETITTGTYIWPMRKQKDQEDNPFSIHLWKQGKYLKELFQHPQYYENNIEDRGGYCGDGPGDPHDYM